MLTNFQFVYLVCYFYNKFLNLTFITNNILEILHSLLLKKKNNKETTKLILKEYFSYHNRVLIIFRPIYKNLN